MILESGDGPIVYIAIDPDGVWARSEFPHPLITVDYDVNDCVIGIGSAGPRVVRTLDAYREWIADGDKDRRRLVDRAVF